jgi:hypothetical protein
VDLDAPIQTDLRRILFKGRFNPNNNFNWNGPKGATWLQWDSNSIKLAEKTITKKGYDGTSFKKHSIIVLAEDAVNESSNISF